MNIFWRIFSGCNEKLLKRFEIKENVSYSQYKDDDNMA